MDSRLKSINYEEVERQRINVADKLMSIVDEDGQPMFNEDWIKQNILREKEETKKPE